MIYSKEDMSRMEKRFEADPVIKDGPLDYDIDEECIIVKNIQVVGMDMHLAEPYKKIAIPRKMPKIGDNELVGTLDEMAEAYSQKGWFVPSMPLFFTIVNRFTTNGIFAGNTITGDYVKELMEDEEGIFNFQNIGYFNTVIDYDNSRLVHYPCDWDMPEGLNKIPGNYLKRQEWHIEKDGLKHEAISENMTHENHKLLLGLTGLRAQDLMESFKYSGGNKGFLAPSWCDPSDYEQKYENKVLPNMFTMCNNLALHSAEYVDLPKRVPLVKIIE